MNTEYLPVPITGKLIPLNEVPDTVFSQKVLGEGFAIKFTGKKVLSPFEGTVIATFPTGHSVIVRRKDGLEILMHVGLSSAKKPGAFNCKVKKYQKVLRGQLLIEVKPEYFDDSSDYCPIVFSTPNIQVELTAESPDVEAFDDRAIRITF